MMLESFVSIMQRLFTELSALSRELRFSLAPWRRSREKIA
jgi:hypothetical protein